MKRSANVPCQVQFPRRPLARTLNLLLAGLAGLAPLASHAVQVPASILINEQNIQTDNPSVPAVRAAAGESVVITNSQVTTRADGSTALSADGTLSGSGLILQTFGNSAQAVVADNGASIDLEDTHITTNGIGADGL